MTRMLRWLLRGAVALLGLAAIAAVVAGVLVAGSLPDYSAEIRLSGIDAPVTVIRDANAVPHIRAETPHDAWFALGLAHAQDRLWQMEVSRRAVQGRLSALFGARTVALDRLVKTLDLYGHARRAVAHQSPPTRAVLEAYAAGVNAWIRHVNAEALGRGAPEFFVFGVEGLAPWTPADSIAILKGMALRLSKAARSEIRRAQFQLALPPERLGDILPDDPDPAELTPPRFSALFPGLRPRESAPAPRDPLLALLGPAHRPDLAGASNAWAVDQSRSSTRHPLLANDPHLWLQAPSVWYLADMKAPGLAAIGATLPGAPPVVIGHNGRVGWGLTTANVDDQDLYIEKVNPANPAQYLSPLGWRPFKTREIRIEVADGEAIRETVRATRHGPVLSGDQLGAEAVTPEGHVAALAWTALTDEDPSMTALVDLMRADTVDAAIGAASKAVAPAQVATLADRDGVAMVVAGAIPERNPDSPARGRIPAPGWKAVNDWRGLRPAVRNPRVIRPAEGAVANANSRLTDAPYPRHISFDWAPPYRIRRISKALSARRYHSRDGFVAMQTDSVSEMARSVLPLIARELWWRAESGAGEGAKAEALGLLFDWNGEMDQHSPEPLIFMEWMRQLTRRLAADELGGLFEHLAGPQPLFVERVYRDVDGAAVWCDVDKTPEAETCAGIAERALDDALARLARDYGRRIAGWRWGEAHVARQRHVPFGFNAALGLVFNIELETSGGDHTILRGMTRGTGEAPFENVHAAGLRVVYDFADLDRSRMIIATGQSGHPFSRWYDNLALLWARGDTIAMSTDDREARSGAAGVTTLRPAAEP